MAMASTYAEALVAAVQDGQDLVPWAAPNVAALGWEPMDDAVQRALSGPVPTDLAMGIPLLRFASGRDAVPLLPAIINPPVPRASRAWLTCDISPWLREDLAGFRKAHRMREPRTLWVPSGASVVQVTMRNSVADRLQDEVGVQLVWS